MKMGSLMALGVLAATMLQNPAQAQDLSGAIRAMESDPMTAICAANPCRTDVNITLKKPDGSDFVFKLKRGIPKVYNHMASLMAGETVYVEAGEGPDGLKAIRSVDRIEHPDRTITFKYEQVTKSKKKPVLVLTTTNPFDRSLAYHFVSTSADGLDVKSGFVCPIARHETVKRTFKALTVQMLITDMSLAAPDASEGTCK